MPKTTRSTSTSPRTRRLRHSGLTAPQRRFLASDEPFKAFIAGVGGGKTRAGCLEALRQPAGSIGMVLAPTYPMLRDATLRTLLDLVEPAGLIRSWSKSEMRLELVGGRTILFRSADQPDRLRGPNLSWFWADEAAMLDRAVWLIMLGRLRLSPARAWVTSTPRGKNWLYEEFCSGLPGRHLTQASSRTNTYLPGGFVDTLVAAYDESFAAQEVEGSFLDDPAGKLLSAADLDFAATLRREAPARHQVALEGHRRISCDPSEGRGADRSVILVRDDLGILHLEASNTMSPAAIATRIDQLRHEWGVAPGMISVDGGGGAGRDTVTHLKRYGITPRQYFGSGSGGLRYLNLRGAAAWRLREVIQARSFGLARAGSHLPALRKELESLSYHMNRDKLALIQKEDLSKILGHSPDYADCLIQSHSY